MRFLPSMRTAFPFPNALARTIKSLYLLPLVLMPSQAVCNAFPLDPVRIWVRDVSPATGAIDVEVSVWQGNAARDIDKAKCIYVENTQVETNQEGQFAFWLGEGESVKGSLHGSEYALDHLLTLRLRYQPPEEESQLERWFVLKAIDNAYIASRFSRMESNQIGANEDLKGVDYKSYEPSFQDFSPDLVRRGMAILYPDGRIQTEDGSFFHPENTTTSGVQELFDYCSEHHVDGYIVGGSIPRSQQIVYHIWTPLRIRPAQGIRIDTGAISLQFMPELREAPGLTIDSCMMNDIRIRGLLHYRAKGYALAIQPSNPLPLDEFVGNTIVDTAIYITAIACEGAKGAVLFDGSVNFNRFEFNEINFGELGIHATAESNFSNNRITCKHIHGQTDTSIRDESGTANLWEVNLNCDAKNPLGIVTGGTNSLWFANVISREKPGITLLPTATGNQFHLTGLNGGFDNQATAPTNRFYATPNVASAEKIQLGFAASTPEVPESGEAIQNTNPFPVVIVMKSPGTVHRWSLTDAYDTSEAFEGGFHNGQNIFLSPGEAIAIEYDEETPVWRWRTVY